MLTVREAVRQALDNGLCPVPPAEDGSKKPNLGRKWRHFQTRKPTSAELNGWWGGDRPQLGVGLVLGAASDNVECLDFDDGPTWAAFLQGVPADLIEVVARIRTGYEEATPQRGRRHLLYRIDGKTVPGNGKLASGTRQPDGTYPTLIETKGEGGYAIIAPTPAAVHPESPRGWRRITGNLATLATLAADEHDRLMAYCRSFDRSASSHPDASHDLSAIADSRPGDRFNQETGIDAYAQMLIADGWQTPPTGAVDADGRRHLVRPGKNPADGPSANVKAGPDGIPVLYVHSTSAPIPANLPGTGYRPFSYLCQTRGGPAGALDYLRRFGFTQDPPDVSLDALLDNPAPGPSGPGGEVEPIEVRSIADAIADTRPEPPELVAGLIRQGEATVIGAPRGIGKSFLGMQLALMLAAGQGHLFGRHRIMRARNVLYCHGELDHFSARRRWARMLTSPHWLDTTTGDRTPPDGLKETFVQWRIDLRKIRTTRQGAAGTVTTEQSVATIDPRLEARIVADGTDVLILDPWKSYHGGSENSNDDTEAVLAELRRLQLTYDVTVIIIHHIGKNTIVREPEDLWRGASRLADWTSNRVTLTEHYTPVRAAEAGMSRKQARRFLDVVYLRRGAPVDDHSTRRDDDGWWHDWTDGTPETPKVTGRDLIDALAEHGPFKSKKEARDYLGIGSPGTFNRVLKEAGGSIEEIDQGRGKERTIRLAGTRHLPVTPHPSPSPLTGQTPPVTSMFDPSPTEPVAAPPDDPSDLPKRNPSPVTPTGSESPRPEAGGDNPPASDNQPAVDPSEPF